jgi:hypothetical protein
MENILIQAVGCLGFAIYVCASQLPTRKSIFSCEILGTIIVILHWYMLGEAIAICTNVVSIYSAAAVLLTIRFPKAASSQWLSFLLLGGLAYINYEASSSFYIALCGSSCLLIARFFKNFIYLRALNILSGIIWAIYSVMVFSIPTLLFAVFFALGHFIKLLENDHIKTYFRVPQISVREFAVIRLPARRGSEQGDAALHQAGRGF